MLDMKSKAACFTGHRTLPEENLPEIAERLENALIALIEQDYCYFSAGGALGFDTLAAQTVLRLRERYPQIRLILVLPCRSQTRGWSQADIDIYEEIKRRADKVTYTSENYFRGCMQKRNRHLVDNSSICICYLTKPTGGTAYTVNYARRCSLQRSAAHIHFPRLSAQQRTVRDYFTEMTLQFDTFCLITAKYVWILLRFSKDCGRMYPIKL